ncbi:MAG TPA: FtsQ-type POTRA domain-containing protein, partial [Firmicutes bacterium]|nr:FtsQ-type POTRA domain-containing protein [Bacillota bacterium]
FTVRTVEVSGLRRLTRAEVLAVGGVALPANAFALNPRAIQERLAAYPPIAQAKVVRRFPAQLRVEVKERRPVGALPYGEHFLLFDGEGVPFAVTPAPAASGLPKVTGCRLAPVRLGRPAQADDLRWVAAVLESLPPELHRRVQGVEVGRDVTLTLVLTEGSRVLLGSRERMGEKLGLVQSILAEAAENGWTVREVDVRQPDQPFLRRGTPGGGAQGEDGR